MTDENPFADGGYSGVRISCMSNCGDLATSIDCGSLLGKSDVQGAACWHVGFSPYVDGNVPSLGQIQRWRVEARGSTQHRTTSRGRFWFGLCGAALHDGKVEVTTTGYEVRSFITFGMGDEKMVFPEKWVRTAYTSVTESKTDLLFNGKLQPFSETTFTLLAGVAVGVNGDRRPIDAAVASRTPRHLEVRVLRTTGYRNTHRQKSDLQDVLNGPEKHHLLRCNGPKRQAKRVMV